jgi:hypothetical protein
MRRYKVVAPFRLYRIAGTARTNAYYGSARISARCYEAVNARRGDVLAAGEYGPAYLLPRRGGSWAVSLAAPQGMFEKTYSHVTDAEILARDPRVRRTADGDPDLSSARAAQERHLRDLHPQLVEVEPSPEMDEFRAMTAGLAGAAAAAGFENKFSDHTESPVVRLSVHAGDMVDFAGRREPWPSFRVRWAYIPRFVEAEVPGDFPLEGAEPESSETFQGRVALRYRLGAAGLGAVQRSLEAFAGARAALGAAPGP